MAHLQPQVKMVKGFRKPRVKGFSKAELGGSIRWTIHENRAFGLSKQHVPNNASSVLFSHWTACSSEFLIAWLSLLPSLRVFYIGVWTLVSFIFKKWLCWGMMTQNKLHVLKCTIQLVRTFASITIMNIPMTPKSSSPIPAPPPGNSSSQPLLLPNSHPQASFIWLKTKQKKQTNKTFKKRFFSNTFLIA